MTLKRRSYSRAQRVKLFDDAGGMCWRCGLKIHAERGERWHVGHVDIPHSFGGQKVAPEHVHCNMDDAKQVKRDAAKSDRIRAKHLGIQKTTRWLKSIFKKTVDGRVIDRETGKQVWPR